MPLLFVENQRKNKHVEILCIACLDEGSNPSNSTQKPVNYIFTGFFYYLYLSSTSQTMTKFFTAFFLGIFALYFSQTTRVYYTLKYQPNKTDTLKRTQLQVLLFNKDTSTFQSHEVLRRDSVFSVFHSNKEKYSSLNDNDEIYTKSFEYNYIIITQPKSQNIIFKDVISDMQPASYTESVQLKWKLHPEKKIIHSISCQKATTTYGGREWIAWFSTEYNFPYGPYKFYGLPGLIIKIQDSQNHMTGN